jgi:hypothetical protein
MTASAHNAYLELFGDEVDEAAESAPEDPAAAGDPDDRRDGDTARVEARVIRDHRRPQSSPKRSRSENAST